MRMIRISWREALRRFRVVRCRGCNAAENVMDWFVEESSRPLNGPYCPECATRLATAKDEARSVNQFYTDTKGEGVRREI